MLLLSLSVGDESYGIKARYVIEIVPLVKLKKVPLSEYGIKGIFNYRGTPTPVIDLCNLFEQRHCDNILSTRIIIINYSTKSGQSRPVGLIAENVTDVISCHESDIKDSGLKSDESSFLGKIVKLNNRLIQLIDTRNILPESISNQLNSL